MPHGLELKKVNYHFQCSFISIMTYMSELYMDYCYIQRTLAGPLLAFEASRSLWYLTGVFKPPAKFQTGADSQIPNPAATRLVMMEYGLFQISVACIYGSGTWSSLYMYIIRFANDARVIYDFDLIWLSKFMILQAFLLINYAKLADIWPKIGQFES